jgi:hypothetical protein
MKKANRALLEKLTVPEVAKNCTVPYQPEYKARIFFSNAAS